jgi:hypothetical protein
MSLKFPFKFKHITSKYIFTATLRKHEDIVDITWYVDGECCRADYTLNYVHDIVEAGMWQIIAEEEPSPLVEITQDEYTNLIEEINLLQDLLAEANNRITELEGKSKFKPIKDMTYNDWVAACREGQEFKTRGGEIVTVIQMDAEGTSWPVRTENGWYRVNGLFHLDDEVAAEDIIERIS